MTNTIKDIYWVAGLLEGEGCFCFNNSNCPRIRVAMTDVDVVRRARSILDSSRTIETVKRSKMSRKNMYCLSVSGRKAIGWMMTLYPLMGSRRKAKIREVISRWI